MRVAFAGVHRQLDRTLAVHNFAAAFSRDPRTAMVGVFDTGAETRDRFRACWGDLPTFDDFATMLRATEPEVICVATRQTMHADQIEMAAAAGVRGMLCDKPLATSMAEVDRIVAACRRHDVRLAFAVDRRWVRYYDRLVAHLRAGAIGELRAIVVYGPVNVVNHGPHWYDRLLALAGDAEVESVAGWVDPLTNEPADSRRHMDPPGGGQVRLANGVDGYITPRNVGSGFDMSFDLIGSTGRIVVSSDGADTRRWRDGRWGELEGLGPGQGSPWADAPPWPTMVADLFDAVRDRRPTRCDVDAARRASEVAFAIHHSHRAGGRSVSPAEVDRDLRVPSFPWGNE